jgi:hypothetical protein
MSRLDVDSTREVSSTALKPIRWFLYGVSSIAMTAALVKF